MYITTTNYSTNTTSNTLRSDEFKLYSNLFRHRKNTTHYFEGVKKVVLITAFMLGSYLIIGNLFINSVTEHIRNQDIMLCESAKKSGNEDYLKRCECYYKFGDIKCLEVSK
jgi:hypothetical protein